jgi:O-methyltransferase involved in polyketide biosynthesis
MYPDKFCPDFTNKNMAFWARVLHFEKRYRIIDQLLDDLPVKNILELSSGFSFRSLETIRKKEIYYIDTDLPDLIAIKKNIITILLNESLRQEGKLELFPLNALDHNPFQEVVAHFPDGEIAIVNEGLLMYLNTDEQEKLCHNIHKILMECGGYWITGDIYIKNPGKLNLNIDPKTKRFFDQHRIENNKFESFEEAETFFRRMGFRIDKEADMNSSKLSSLKYFMKSNNIKQQAKIRETDKIQPTWLLRTATN